MSRIYFDILDFVYSAKKFEYFIREKYSYSGESIFRGVIDRQIEPKGDLQLPDLAFSYKFHGLGIDIICNEKMYKYNHYSGKDGLGVYFNLEAIYNSNSELPINVYEEFQKLIDNNLVKQWMPEMPLSKVFYLV